MADDLSAAIERLERFAETNDIWTAYLGFTHPLQTVADDLRAVLPSLFKPPIAQEWEGPRLFAAECKVCGDGLAVVCQTCDSALPRSSPPDAWREIESAPRDGTTFDAWVPDSFGGRRMTSLSFDRRGQLRQDGLLTKAELPRWPTHWMPLPSPPPSTKGAVE
jgi:hypothetical protein